jgi:hypothetical protein
VKVSDHVWDAAAKEKTLKNKAKDKKKGREGKGKNTYYHKDDDSW